MRRKLIYSGIILVLIISTIVISSSLDLFSNVKVEDSNPKEVLIKDFLGNDVAYLTLLTPLDYKILRGENRKVAEFKVEVFDDVSVEFEKVDFYNLKRDSEEVNKDFVYKYKRFYEGVVIDYEQICSDEKIWIEKNKTFIINNSDCVSVEVGSHIGLLYDWVVFDGEKGLLEENLTFGIFTDVEAGERVEWIPTFFGVEIDEWAVWEESLNVDLIFYYNMEQNGQIDDVHDGSDDAVVGADINYLNDGIISNSIYLNGDNGDWFATDLTWVTDSTLSFWFNHTEAGNNNNRFWFTNVSVNYLDDLTITYDIADTDWHNVVYTAGADGNLSVYVDGVIQNSEKEATLGGLDILLFGPTDSPVAYLYDGSTAPLYFSEFDDVQKNLVGYVDEVAYWNRVLTPSEISDLWNGGDGITYTAGSDPCSCAGEDNNWELNHSEACVINDFCNLGTGRLNFTGTGTTVCNATINTTGMGDPLNGGTLQIDSNCSIIVN